MGPLGGVGGQTVRRGVPADPGRPERPFRRAGLHRFAVSLVTLTQMISTNREGEGIERRTSPEPPGPRRVTGRVLRPVGRDGRPARSGRRRAVGERSGTRRRRRGRPPSGMGPRGMAIDPAAIGVVRLAAYGAGVTEQGAPIEGSPPPRLEAATDGRWRGARDPDRDVGGAAGDHGGDRHGRFSGPRADSRPKVEEEGRRGASAIGRDDRASAPHAGPVLAAPGGQARRAGWAGVAMPSRLDGRIASPLRSRRGRTWASGFDDQSRDSLDAEAAASASFSMLRARKRELLEEQRSAVGRGPAAAARGAAGPVAHRPGQRPGRRQPAPGRLPAEAPPGRGGQPGGIRAAIPRADRGRSERLLAQETVCRSMGRRERGHGIPPPLARRGRRGLRLPPGPAARRGRLRPGVPGGAGRPGGPPRRPEGHGHRRGASRRPSPSCCTPTSSRSIRSTRIAARACAPSACPTWAGRASRRSWPGSGPIRRGRSPASSSCAPWRRSRPRGPTRCAEEDERRRRTGRPRRARRRSEGSRRPRKRRPHWPPCAR